MYACGNSRAGFAYFKRRKSGSVGQYRGCRGPRSIPLARKKVLLPADNSENLRSSKLQAATSLRIVKHLSNVVKSSNQNERCIVEHRASGRDGTSSFLVIVLRFFSSLVSYLILLHFRGFHVSTEKRISSFINESRFSFTCVVEHIRVG